MGTQGWREDAEENGHGEPIFREMISVLLDGERDINGGCASRRGEQEYCRLLLSDGAGNIEPEQATELLGRAHRMLSAVRIAKALKAKVRSRLNNEWSEGIPA